MNIGEIFELAQVVAEYGASELKLHQLRMVGNAADNPELAIPDGDARLGGSNRGDGGGPDCRRGDPRRTGGPLCPVSAPAPNAGARKAGDCVAVAFSPFGTPSA